MAIFEWTALWSLIGVPVLRSVAGWANNALKDNVVTNFEWKQLGRTIIRVGLIGFAAFFGFNGMGLDVSAIGAAFSALIIDKFISAWKSRKVA